MTDLRTSYLGLHLRSPIVASAGPHTGDLDTVRRLADAGVGAIVLPSLFEEEVLEEELLLHALEANAHPTAEADGYLPRGAIHGFVSPADRYLAHLEATREAVDVPVIASLNATSSGGWVRYASILADAGADAIELNLYHVAADATRSGAEVEAADVALVAEVTSAVDVPIAVKLSPYYSSLAHLAGSFVDAGARGLVCFNRFYQPDLDVDSRSVIPRVELSSPWELRLPLRWIAILRPLLPLASLAATSGIATGTDVAKALLVGADVAMMTSALLRYGPDHVRTVEEQLLRWASDHDYESVSELRGSVSHLTCSDPSSFERANYLRTLHSWS